MGVRVILIDAYPGWTGHLQLLVYDNFARRCLENLMLPGMRNAFIIIVFSTSFLVSMRNYVSSITAVAEYHIF